MASFKTLGDVVESNFKSMTDAKNAKVFVADITGDELWDHYLASFPEGTNPIYVNRTEHDCSCCRNFVKNLGGVIAFNDKGETLTVWDNVKPDGNDSMYVTVAQAMAEFVKAASIKSKFYVSEPVYGSRTSGGFNHFYARVPSIFKPTSGADVGKSLENVAILKRSLEEITDDSVDVVLDLISQKSLYKGAEFKKSVEALKKVKRIYNALSVGKEREIFLFMNATVETRFRNTVIGTLLVDLSEGKELDHAVNAFESKVAPLNYKRPTALVTPKMIESAKRKVEELGIEDSLYRRHATRADISVNDVLFCDNNVREVMIGGAFDNLKATKKPTAKKFDKVESVSIDYFIENILPKANTVELLVEHKLMNRFVSLVAPQHSTATSLFKWDNGFSWSYDGEVTDSIKHRVKKAGGKIDSDIRVSMSWHNSDDMDLSIKHKSQVVYYSRPHGFGCHLDVDTNGIGASNYIDPVENVTWANAEDMPLGEFEIVAHQFSKRGTSNPGYEIEVEILGQLYSYETPRSLPSRAKTSIGTIVKDSKGITVVSDLLKKGSSSQEKWNIDTESWVNVDMVMKSPNYWGDNSVGNEHVFFMLKDCKNPDSVRGFYNEFLRSDINEHRKVLELLASNMKAEYDDNQLSGIGISTTSKEEITVRVSGAISRTLKITF